MALPEHSTEENFVHFLNYENLPSRGPYHLGDLRKAFYAGAKQPPPLLNQWPIDANGSPL